jgi:hypothetical protein
VLSSSAPPCFVKMWLVRPWYIFPGLPRSFSAFLNCSPMHVRYVVLSEKALNPKSSCGN